MKKALLIGVVGMMLTAGPCLAQMGPGMMTDSSAEEAPQAEQYYPCGMMGGYGMGPGMMMGGYGMGPGMMMGGYGMGQGMMGYGTGAGMMGGYGMGPGMMRGYYGKGYGHGSGRGSGMWNADSEKYNKFMDETVSLRKKIHEKQFDYFEAARNPKTSQDTLLKLEKELFDLRQQMQKKGWETFHEN